MEDRSELTAFIGLLEGWSLSACEIALWHALHDVSILCGRSDGLSIATGRLMVLTGFSKKSVERARDRLRDIGAIQWASRSGRRSAVYSLNSLVRHPDAQTTPQSTPQGYPQSTPQPTPQSTPINTTDNNVVRSNVPLPRQGDAQSTPQTAPQSTPQNCAGRYLLSDAEADALMPNEAAINATFNDAMSIGIPNTASDLNICTLYVARFTAAWVQEAIRRTAEAPRDARSWRYIRRILENWEAAGSIDGPGKPVAQESAEDGSSRAERARYQAQCSKILRGEYD